jgi:hypothetical protein
VLDRQSFLPPDFNALHLVLSLRFDFELHDLQLRPCARVGEMIELMVRRGEGGDEKDVQELKFIVKLEASKEAK